MSSFAQQGTSKASINQDREAEKRRDNALTLRKKKKEELLREKRQKASEPQDGAEPSHVDEAEARRIYEALPEIARLLVEGTLEDKFNSAQAIRKVLSAKEGPPITRVIELGCLPHLVQLLRCDEHHQVQFEAAWALTNVASGTTEQTREVVQNHAIPELARLLSSPSEEVREQVVWALGNIAGDNAKNRDKCIDEGCFPPLLKIIHSEPRLTTLRNAAWLLSNLVRNKPSPPFAKVEGVLPTVAGLLSHADKEVLADACWALSYISDGENERIAAILSLNIAPRVIELLDSPDNCIHAPALRAVGNIVSGTPQQTQTMIDGGALPRLGRLAGSGLPGIRKEVFWALSNVAAGTVAQARALIDCGLCAPMVEALGSASFEVRKEAVWAITNVTHARVPEHTHAMVMARSIPPMVELLGMARSSTVMVKEMLNVIKVILEFCENVLAVGESISNRTGAENVYKNEFIECSGLDVVNDVLAANPDLMKKAQTVLRFFPEQQAAFEPEMQDINLEPTVTDFKF
eukprot:TRINITY_DN870_c0_g2_i1.p1 TRINITY_DN870_c0_g2~~TRINITY_DN870_c0_g2_i1.p1  ORF type:complete len:520 (+),score=211.57 TRINITY_DN870_c0_g2_i1:76-1635(+)